jgi:hypothetical protein
MTGGRPIGHAAAVLPSGEIRGVLFDYGNVIGSIDHDDLAGRIRAAGGVGDASATRGVLEAATGPTTTPSLRARATTRRGAR